MKKRARKRLLHILITSKSQVFANVIMTDLKRLFVRPGLLTSYTENAFQFKFY